MIDPQRPLASWFLLVGGVVFLVVYAIPLLFVPLQWARLFRWELPERTHLAVYLGRCLGGMALAVVIFIFRAVPDPRPYRVLFELVALMSGLLALVHVWGAIRRIQPWTEHAEIVLYATVAALSAWIGTRL